MTHPLPPLPEPYHGFYAAPMYAADQMRDYARAALAADHFPDAGEKVVPATGAWQPIETAPKDGRRILLHPAVEVADAWSKGHWSEDNKCWLSGGDPMGFEPTHWMHLPSAPKEIK